MFKFIYATLVEALFPLSAAEREIFSLPPDRVPDWPSAPSYVGLTISGEEATCMRSLFAYKDDRVAKFVWNIKYKKSAPMAAIGGLALWEKLKNEKIWKDSKKLVLPVPITAKRRRERGYNQCELLVDEISKLAAAKGADKSFIIEKNLLVRVRHASRQTLKGRAERARKAAGIFAVDEDRLAALLTDDPESRKYPIVVIDDVITTGSTMKSAMDAVKAAGFEKVYGLSLAH